MEWREQARFGGHGSGFERVKTARLRCVHITLIPGKLVFLEIVISDWQSQIRQVSCMLNFGDDGVTDDCGYFPVPFREQLRATDSQFCCSRPGMGRWLVVLYNAGRAWWLQPDSDNGFQVRNCARKTAGQWPTTTRYSRVRQESILSRHSSIFHINHGSADHPTEQRTTGLVDRQVYVYLERITPAVGRKRGKTNAWSLCVDADRKSTRLNSSH